MNRTYQLKRDLRLDRPLEEVFAFFSDAGNLQVITPPFMDFRVVTPQPIEMKPGTLIDYRLKVHGVPIRWRSEITVWEPPHCFVDEQRIGPYKYWHHEHTFRQIDGGTQIGDVVDYQLRGGPVAPLIHWLMVKRDVNAIFDYRQDKLRELFSESHLPPAIQLTA